MGHWRRIRKSLKEGKGKIGRLTTENKSPEIYTCDCSGPRPDFYKYCKELGMVTFGDLKRQRNRYMNNMSFSDWSKEYNYNPIDNRFEILDL